MVHQRFALGTLLQLRTATGSPDTYVTIPEVGPITGPGATRDTYETTTHSAKARGGYKEYGYGLKDGGELTASINWLFDDADQNRLLTCMDADNPAHWRVLYDFTDDGYFDEFDAYVTELGQDSPTDAQSAKPLTLKITGPITRDTES